MIVVDDTNGLGWAESVAGVMSAGTCLQEIAFRHAALVPYALIYRTSTGWAYREVYPYLEETYTFTPDQPVDQVMALRITGDPCSQMWWETACCFTPECTTCTPDLVTPRLSFQTIPARSSLGR